MITAPVNKIIDSSLVDGPGNRTAVFFQGCNYRCTYCHNPETMGLCSACGECVKVCPEGALALNDGAVEWDDKRCVGCDSCIAACPSLSSPKIKNMTSDEIITRLKRNMPFISGLTCSGGECTLYAEFLRELFLKAQSLGLSCLIDSNGSYDFRNDGGLLDAADGVMLDIKSADPDNYKSVTGADGREVMDIAAFLASKGKLTEARTVVFDNEDARKTVDAVSTLLAPYEAFGDIHYRILAFRPFGVRKEYQNLKTPSAAKMEALKSLARSNGMTHVSAIY